MSTLATDAPLAVAVTEAIQTGDLAVLRRVLREHPDLAAAHLGDEGEARTLLHVATDWPGHFPNGPAVVAALVEAGADVNAPFVGPHAETPLHWAASSDDVEVLDALVDAGADVEAPGAVLGGGTPLADAVGFGQWRAARRLLERGARTTLWQAAALGLLDRVEERFAGTDPPAPDEVTDAFWQACHGGQRQTAEYLRYRGADLNWVGWNDRTPLDIAEAQGAGEVVEWLRSQGGRSAAELR
jgi:ankyrin repeat protein